jgi:hypothetical protein
MASGKGRLRCSSSVALACGGKGILGAFSYVALSWFIVSRDSIVQDDDILTSLDAEASLLPSSEKMTE